MLGDGDNVGARDLEHLDTMLDGGIEVDVVGADTGSYAKLEVLCLLDQVGSEISGVEGGGDDDVSLERQV